MYLLHIKLLSLPPNTIRISPVSYYPSLIVKLVGRSQWWIMFDSITIN